MVDQTSHMFITGPDVIKTVTGEDVGFEELGGARTHNTKSGVAHFMATDEADALDLTRRCCPTCPSNNLEDAAAFDSRRRPTRSPTTTVALDTLIPDSREPPVRHAHGDRGDRRRRRVPRGAAAVRAEHPRAASAASRATRSASSPTSRCSSPAPSTSTRRRRPRASCAPATPSTSRCSPSSTCPGFLPGTDQEWNGIIRRGAKLIYAYAEATVPLVTVITRKAYGGAYDVMGSKHLGADINLAWPTAQIAVMGAQGAVNILHRQRARRRRPTPRPSAGAAHRSSTRTRCSTRTSPPSAATSTRSSSRRETRAAGRPALRMLRNKRQNRPPQEAREHPPLVGS